MNARTAKVSIEKQAPSLNEKNGVKVMVGDKELFVPNDEQMQKDGLSSLSARIRHLHGLGVSTANIAKIVKRSNGAHPIYQHVRNVLNTPLKKVEAQQG